VTSVCKERGTKTRHGRSRAAPPWWRWTSRPRELPSRPGEFHSEPLTDSGRDTLASSGSCHRLKAAAFRQNMELFRSLTQSRRRCPPSLHAITRASLRVGPPLFPRIATFSLADEPLVPFRLASPDRFSSPHESPNAWPVGRLPPCLSRNSGETLVFVSSKLFTVLQTEVHSRSSLSSIPDAVIAAPFDHDVHHRGIWPKQLMVV
jgi:hypothetical protein